ncbi:MAG: alpha-1,2-fucosyltransferase [Chlamydiia bacterium]
MFKYSCFALLLFVQSLYSEETYVEGYLWGQLGNQLFIVAATYTHALDHGAIPVFPNLGNQNGYGLPVNREKIFPHLNAFDPKLVNVPTYEDTNHHYRELPFSGSMILKGFFQSEKYFRHRKEEILELFAPSEEIKQTIACKYSDILKHPKTVSVHVRMYQDTLPIYHPFVGWRYIHKAMDLFDEDSLFLVFSDNIPQCKRALSRSKQKNLVYIEGNSHYIDLHLMSMCKDHIISNSSFSWWGAYLNKNTNKRVFTPFHKRWFGSANAHLNTEDLIPEEWVELL